MKTVSFYLHLVAGDAISAPSHPSLAQEELYKDYQHQASSWAVELIDIVIKFAHSELCS